MMADEEAPKKAAKKAKPEPKPKLPGEGDPFGNIAQAYSVANRDGGSAFQPRAISDATSIDRAHSSSTERFLSFSIGRSP